MTNKLITYSTAMLLASASPLLATEGWYLSIGGGANHVEDDTVKTTGFNQEIEYDFGYAAKGAVGYQYENGLRSELELAYRNNDVDTISAIRATGDVTTYSAMLNVLYDFDISETGLDTYVGVGAGIAHVDLNNVTPVGFGFTQLDDSDTTPALQGIVGVSYDIADATEIYANYNYFHATNPDFSDAVGTDYKTDYNTSTIMLGLKFNMFDTPQEIVEPKTATEPTYAEPAPIPEPAPEPEPAPVSRTYLVFFDFDRADLTQEAVSVLRQAAADAKAGNAVAIEVVGHADRAGTEEYNMGLSERRAKTVHMALQQLNIPGDNIRAMAKGESDPLVPTEDGVREPQNRRVEIMYMITPN